MHSHLVVFEPKGIRVSVQDGVTVLEAARQTGLQLESQCGGRGTCGKCRVVLNPAGNPSDTEISMLSRQELDQGMRLACIHEIHSDMRVVFPQVLEKAKILTESTGLDAHDLRPDGKRGEYGIAIDLGTTTVVCYLVDLHEGTQLGQIACLNPQIIYGEDVMSRITYSLENDDGGRQLQQRVVKRIDQMIGDLCQETSVLPQSVTRLAVVGNTAMHHLFLGIDTKTLGFSPYVPAVYDAVQTSASELGITTLGAASVYCPPNIAGFVGGDTVSFILSQRFDQHEGHIVGIDIGTNGEIVIVNEGDIYCCSAAAGSAFEGATIYQGMRGQEGAIEHVKIKNPDDAPEIATIGRTHPRGICGSAIVDIVAEMRLASLLDESGRFQKSQRIEQVKTFGRVYVVADAGENGAEERIVFTQKDVRQVQLAKAAIQAGTKIGLATASVSPKDIDIVVLAGAFGNYIHPESAIEIGLIPSLPQQRILPVGNAAGDGARRMTLSHKQRRITERIAKGVQYIELAGREGFQEEFLASTVLRPWVLSS